MISYTLMAKKDLGRKKKVNKQTQNNSGVTLFRDFEEKKRWMRRIKMKL